MRYAGDTKRWSLSFGRQERNSVFKSQADHTAWPTPTTAPPSPTSPSPSDGTGRGRASRPLPARRWRPAPCPPRACATACRAHWPSAAAAQPWRGPGSGPAASLAGPAHRHRPAGSGAEPGNVSPALRPSRSPAHRRRSGHATRATRSGLSAGPVTWGAVTGPAGAVAHEGHHRACHAGGSGRPLPNEAPSRRQALDAIRNGTRRAEPAGKESQCRSLDTRRSQAQRAGGGAGAGRAGNPRTAVTGHAEQDNLRAISSAFGTVTTRAESAFRAVPGPKSDHSL